LVCPAWWVSHLERDWKQPAFRDFFSALAQHRTVVRYDRPGVGLSSRDRHDFTQLTEVEVLDAIVAGLAQPTVDLLAFSCAAPVALAWAAANPGRVHKLVFVGAYACGSDLGPDHIRDALIGLVEAHWGMGAATINRLFSPDLSSEDARSFGRDQLASASPETAAKLLGLSFALDARGAAARITCPALVIHRKGDHTVPFDVGRHLAADLPDATFLPVPGGAHLPWLGDAESILSAMLSFLNDTPAADVPAIQPSWKRC
jgi:pimeloyl-ACP methyl ester carboxylesterase